MSIVDKELERTLNEHYIKRFGSLINVARDLEAHCDAIAKDLSDHQAIQCCHICESHLQDYEKFRQERAR